MKRKEKMSRREKWMLSPYRLAHHPLCKNFDDHMYIIRGYKVCRGCVNLYSGMIAGLILAPIMVFVLKVTFWMAFAATVSLFIFTPISAFLEPPRLIKDISRFFLGIAMISAGLSIILSIVALAQAMNWWAFAVILITLFLYFVSRAYFTGFRNRKNEQVCRNCDQFYHPRCDGMVDAVDRAKAIESFNKGDAFSEQ
ncbi:MAG: hypothetical protein H7644_04695 [Candidatus Heimdallarchaeota archaeon]|nr:hypothetical protein [Candidatus Heimdallarchaeota archaeon]MCK5143042.1 hypothetical protein [Candidatus Heimdallarchaeota archaeon]